MLKKALLRLHADTLFRNSFYLILATGALAAFGFFFWLISARLFPAENIGVATTLISTMNLIALLSLVGFDTTLVRFLPTSTQRNEQMNTALVLVVATSFLLSGGFILYVKEISPSLSIIRESPWYLSIFMFSCIMNSVGVLADSIFLAGKKAKYTLLVSVISSTVKIAAPFAFVGFGTMGIFAAAGLAQITGTWLSIGILLRQFGYLPRLAIHAEVVKDVWRYSGVNYVTNVLNLIPPALLPIVIINALGPSAAAYYYIVMMVGNLLYTISWSTTKSFFAESSHDESNMRRHMFRAIQTIAALTIPAMVILLVFGKNILAIFGDAYVDEGAPFLYFVTFTAIAVGINSIYGSIFRVLKKLSIIFATNVIYVVGMFLSLYFLLPLGLFGVGLAWFLGSTLTSAANALSYRFAVRSPRQA